MATLRDLENKMRSWVRSFEVGSIMLRYGCVKPDPLTDAELQSEVSGEWLKTELDDCFVLNVEKHVVRQTGQGLTLESVRSIRQHLANGTPPLTLSDINSLSLEDVCLHLASQRTPPYHKLQVNEGTYVVTLDDSDIPLKGTENRKQKLAAFIAALVQANGVPISAADFGVKTVHIEDQDERLKNLLGQNAKPGSGYSLPNWLR